MQTKPAYEAFDKGRKALQDKDLNTARSLAQQAIALEPKEAIFYGLLGDVEQQDRHLEKAVQQYSKAIDLNPSFFYHYLQRGKVNQQLNLSTKAEADLKHSAELLPTADAYYLLGNLSRQAGKLDTAKNYYAKVAGSSNAIGKQALGALVDLDLKDNPAKYLTVATWQDKKGNIIARISNPTPRVISGVKLAVDVENAQGRKQRFQVSLPGSVAAESQKLFDLGITEKLQELKAKGYSLNIVAARVAN